MKILRMREQSPRDVKHLSVPGRCVGPEIARVYISRSIKALINSLIASLQMPLRLPDC